VHRSLFPALQELAQALTRKANDFADVIKAGRTHLQDAVPIRLGDTFAAFHVIVADHLRRLEQGTSDLQILGIGGSAAGTGLNTHPNYRQAVVALLSDYTQLDLRPAPHLMAAMQSMAPFVHLSGCLRNLAQDLIKLANDLRLMDSGPSTGLKEIRLPPVQPGSSIMPGKYNPVMAEMLNMVCFQVMGLDSAIALCGQAGQFELNVMMPLIAYDLLHSIQILSNGIQVFTQRCVLGITAVPDRCQTYAETTLALVTALNPYIGYLNAAEVAKESLATGKAIRDIVLERQLLSPEQITTILDLDVISRMNS
jgi:aspartate ammonia-lyase